ncbi:Hydrogenase-3 component G [Providencia rustigianii]|nr:Hydrogenase-3 component G [Providencia rustigianii]
MALGLLQQKLVGQDHREADDERVELLLPSIPLATRVMIEREARRQAGYFQGREISDQFLSLLDGATPSQVQSRMQQWMDQEQDPRLRDIVNRLVTVLQQGGINE